MRIPLQCLTRAAAAVTLLVALPAYSHGEAIDEQRVGRLLASNCAACHGTGGRARDAMPRLAGQNKQYIVDQMQQFKTGKRPATIMHQLAKGYTDEQINALAEYFSRQKGN